jgi:type II secretory pathway predicted ATPase ExeA
VDPFAPTADPAAYIPREVTEKALAQLEHGVRHGRRVQVLSGPPGVGKTLLVHVLAERLAGDFRTLYLPYASLDFGELCRWILGLLGEPSGSFPDRELLASARASAGLGRPLLLLVDEASSIPPESAVGLAELVEEARGGLCLLLVPIDEARAGRVLSVLARDVAELRISAQLSLEESEHYVRTRLVRAGTPFELQRRFDAALLKRLQRASGGNPQRLQQLAGEVLRGNLAALPAYEAGEALDAPERDATSELEIDALEALDVRPAARGSTSEGGAALASDAAPSWNVGADAATSARSEAGRAQPAAAQPESERAVRPPPSDRLAAHGPPLPAVPYQAPHGPDEPRGTNWGVVFAINFALVAGALLGLWASGFLPPPAH